MNTRPDPILNWADRLYRVRWVIIVMVLVVLFYILKHEFPSIKEFFDFILTFTGVLIATEMGTQLGFLDFSAGIILVVLTYSARSFGRIMDRLTALAHSRELTDAEAGRTPEPSLFRYAQLFLGYLILSMLVVAIVYIRDPVP